MKKLLAAIIYWGLSVGIAAAQGVPNVGAMGVPNTPPLTAANAAGLLSLSVPRSKVISAIGDSTNVQSATNVPAGSQFFPTSFQVGLGGNNNLAWLTSFSEGALVVDPAQSYPGSLGGLLRVIPTTAGSCTPNVTLTFTPSAPTGSLPNQAGTFTVATDANGAVVIGQVISLASPGSGYAAPPTYTVSGGTCATQPVFAYVLGGVIGFGVGGDNTSGVIARLAYDRPGTSICTRPPDFAIVSVGTNDLTQGVLTPQQIATNIQSIVTTLQSCGVIPIIRGISSRNQTGAWTATLDKQRLWINRQSQTFAQQSRFASGVKGPVLYFDTDRFDTDATVSTGNPIVQATYDGLHQATWRGFVEAMEMWREAQPYVSPSMLQPNSQNDVYDATNNPTGNLIGTAGLMVGAGGTVGPCAGTVATGWTITSAGTGVLVCSSSIESTQTNGQTGQRQVITISNTGGGNAESVTLTSNSGILPAASISKGTDKLSLYFNIDVSNATNVEFSGGQIFETASPTNQSMPCLYGISTTGANLYMPPSSQIAKWSYASLLPDYGLTGAGSFRVSCPGVAVLTQASATSYAIIIRIQGTSSGGTFGGTFKIGNVAVRKSSWLLERDISPTANDNSPAWLARAA